MKHLLMSITVFIVVTLQLVAQSFLVPGTEWTHCWAVDHEIPTTWFEMKTIAHSADSLQDLGCAWLVLEGGLAEADSIKICEGGERVYYVENDSLHLFFDYSLEVGESFNIRMPHTLYAGGFWEEQFPNEYLLCLEPKTIEITGIEEIELNGMTLREFSFLYTSDREWIATGKAFIEGMGYEWIFPYIHVDWAEGDIVWGLSEYELGSNYFLAENSVCFESNTKSINSQELIVYPNPVSQSINFENSSISAGAIISILSIQGHVVLNQSLTDWRLDVSTLPPGVYVAKLTDRDQVYTTRFVKM